MKKVYSFDFKKLLIDYLHRLDITPKRVAWIYAMMTTVKKIHNAFLVFIIQQEKKLTLLPQMIIIEKYLQKEYHADIYLEEYMPLREVIAHIPKRTRYKAADIVQFVLEHSHIGTQVSINEFYLP